MKINYQLIGKNIKLIRTKKGLSQLELGEKIGLTSINISKIERGKQKLTLNTIEKIAKSLKIDKKDLMEEIDIDKIENQNRKIDPRWYNVIEKCTKEQEEFILKMAELVVKMNL